MKKLFNFDVTLKELMNLASVTDKNKNLQNLCKKLTDYWYLVDGKIDAERWNSVRIGSVNVYVDKDKSLHIDFVTRFTVPEDFI